MLYKKSCWTVLVTYSRKIYGWACTGTRHRPVKTRKPNRSDFEKKQAPLYSKFMN